MAIFEDGKLCDTELSCMVDKLRLACLNSYSRAMFKSVSKEEIMALCQLMILSVQNSSCFTITRLAMEMKKAKRKVD